MRRPAPLPATLLERKQRVVRERIVAAAPELCYAHGFDHVSVSDIAARAEVGRTTFFRYFGDKSEVVFAKEQEMLDAISSVAQEGSVSGAQTLTEALEQLRTIVLELCDRATADREGYARHRQLLEQHLELRARDALKLQQVADRPRDVLPSGYGRPRRRHGRSDGARLLPGRSAPHGHRWHPDGRGASSVRAGARARSTKSWLPSGGVVDEFGHRLAEKSNVALVHRWRRNGDPGPRRRRGGDGRLRRRRWWGRRRLRRSGCWCGRAPNEDLDSSSHLDASRGPNPAEPARAADGAAHRRLLHRRSRGRAHHERLRLQDRRAARLDADPAASGAGRAT